MKRLPPGVYKVDPQVILRHVIAMTLGVASSLENRGALQTIGTDNALADRAATIILNRFLRATAADHEMTHEEYEEQLDALCALAGES